MRWDRSEGDDFNFLDPQSGRIRHRNRDRHLRRHGSFGWIDPAKAVCQRGLERSMAMHEDRWNYHRLYQEGRLSESLTDGRDARAGALSS
jgi:hypothetical protein